jgi:hypothetical protein
MKGKDMSNIQKRTLADGNVIHVHPGDLFYPFEFVPDVLPLNEKVPAFSMASALNLSDSERSLSNMGALLSSKGIMYPMTEKTAALLDGRRHLVCFKKGKLRRKTKVYAELCGENFENVLLTKAAPG